MLNAFQDSNEMSWFHVMSMTLFISINNGLFFIAPSIKYSEKVQPLFCNKIFIQAKLFVDWNCLGILYQSWICPIYFLLYVCLHYDGPMMKSRNMKDPWVTAILLFQVLRLASPRSHLWISKILKSRHFWNRWIDKVRIYCRPRSWRRLGDKDQTTFGLFSTVWIQYDLGYPYPWKGLSRINGIPHVSLYY